MTENEKKGITVKVDAELHAEVKQYVEEHGMTMAEFITIALQDELHPKFNEKEEITMEKTRTIAFQTSDEIFEKLNDYLHRHGLKKNKFFIDFITKVLEEDQAMQDKLKAEKEMAETEDADEAMDNNDIAKAEEISEEEEFSDEEISEEEEPNEDMDSDEELSDAEEINEDIDEDMDSAEELDEDYENEDFEDGDDEDMAEDNSYSHGFDMSMSM